MSFLSIILLPTSHPVWTRREICTDQAMFTSKNSPKHCRLYFSQKKRFKVKHVFMDWKRTAFHFTKTWIDGLEWCGLLWCLYQMFGLSFWRHPFTAENQLVSKWCNATFFQISSDEETNSSTSSMNYFFKLTQFSCFSVCLNNLRKSDEDVEDLDEK